MRINDGREGSMSDVRNNDGTEGSMSDVRWSENQ